MRNMPKVCKKLAVVHIYGPAGAKSRICGKKDLDKRGVLYSVEASRGWDPAWDDEYRRCIKCWNNPKLQLLLLKDTEL